MSSWIKLFNIKYYSMCYIHYTIPRAYYSMCYIHYSINVPLCKLGVAMGQSPHVSQIWTNLFDNQVKHLRCAYNVRKQANGTDPDQLPHFVASDQGLHCLHKHNSTSNNYIRGWGGVGEWGYLAINFLKFYICRGENGRTKSVYPVHIVFPIHDTSNVKRTPSHQTMQIWPRE